MKRSLKRSLRSCLEARIESVRRVFPVSHVKMLASMPLLKSLATKITLRSTQERADMRLSLFSEERVSNNHTSTKRIRNNLRPSTQQKQLLRKERRRNSRDRSNPVKSSYGDLKLLLLLWPQTLKISRKHWRKTWLRQMNS